MSSPLAGPSQTPPGTAPDSPVGEQPDKRAWRRRIRATRRDRMTEPDAPSRRVALARTLADHVLMASAGRAPVVAAYRALPTEPPTTVLLHELVRRGRTVLVPGLLPDRDLDWRVLAADARPGEGCDTHAGVDAVARAGLVIVPALAVDRFGTRLGQGGGSYDRALRRVGAGVPIVALVYDDEALLAADDPPLPREPHDAGVTAVITPGRGWIPLDALAPAVLELGD